jgi:hypothetical protein
LKEGLEAMKRKRYTEEQIAFCLRQHEAGTSLEEIVRKMGISEQTFYRWKKKFAGLPPYYWEFCCSVQNGVEPWTRDISHGELIRNGYDETLTIDPKNLQMPLSRARSRQQRAVSLAAVSTWALETERVRQVRVGKRFDFSTIEILER